MMDSHSNFFGREHCSVVFGDLVWRRWKGRERESASLECPLNSNDSVSCWQSYGHEMDPEYIYIYSVASSKPLTAPRCSNNTERHQSAWLSLPLRCDLPGDPLPCLVQLVAPHFSNLQHLGLDMFWRRPGKIHTKPAVILWPFGTTQLSRFYNVLHCGTWRCFVQHHPTKAN